MKQPIPIDFLNFTSSRRKISTYFTFLNESNQNFFHPQFFTCHCQAKTAGNSHYICFNFPSNCRVLKNLKLSPKTFQVILKISSQIIVHRDTDIFLKHYRLIIENRKKTGYRYRYRKQLFKVSVPNPADEVLSGVRVKMVEKYEKKGIDFFELSIFIQISIESHIKQSQVTNLYNKIIQMILLRVGDFLQKKTIITFVVP